MTADLSKIQRLIILFGVLSVAAAGWSFLYSMDSNMKNMSGMGMNMKMDKSMGHSHSNSVLLEPKQKGDIIWKFDNAVNIEVACNVPGHYQAGMIAKVNIK